MFLGRCTWRDRTVSPPDVMSSFPAAGGQSVRETRARWRSEIWWREAKRNPSCYIWTKPLICSQNSVSYHHIRISHRVCSETIQISHAWYTFKVESGLMPNKQSLVKIWILTGWNKRLDSSFCVCQQLRNIY